MDFRCLFTVNVVKSDKIKKKLMVALTLGKNEKGLKMNKDDLFTPEEIAQKLKITKYTVYEMIKRGELDAHRLGKKIRISGDQFELYLIRSKGSTNTYVALIEEIDGQTLGNIGPVSIVVNTELTGEVNLSIRPEDIILSQEHLVCSASNVLKGKVMAIFQEEGSAKVLFDLGIPMVALITQKSLERMKITIGKEYYLVFKAMTVKVYK